MPVIGITGGLACGKSTVARLLAQHGATLLSADDIAHEITAAGSAVAQEIARVFGPEVLDKAGKIDRKALGSLVFHDSEKRKQLESITHPAILRLLKERISSVVNERAGSLVIVEVPLLFEAGIESWFDCILVVAASEQIQLQRLRERNGLTEEEARARIESQMPLNEKVARGDFVLWNVGGLDDLSAQIDLLWFKLLDCKRTHARREAS
jgi:dephospho-CoA kinase